MRLTIALALGTAAAFRPAVTPLAARALRPRAAAPLAQEDELNVVEMANGACDGIMQMLGDGVPPPKGLAPLKAATQDGDPGTITQKLYELMVEQALEYDVADEKLVLTTVDYSKKDDARVMEKLSYIYRYGITMFQRGMLAEEPLKEIVLTKIASRVGMNGEEFDQWLQVPAVPK